MQHKLTPVIAGLLALILGGCSLTGGGTPVAELTPTPTAPPPTPTLVLAPTLPPAGAEATSAAPTPLPPPTEIPAETPVSGTAEATPEAGETAAPTVVPTPDDDQPGISIRPDLGEPGEAITVTGSNFQPFTDIKLHWAGLEGPHGPVVETIRIDENGAFQITLTVPPADQWPGRPAVEGDFIQLRAVVSPTTYYWANFRYVKRYQPGVTLVLTYTSEAYGYAVDLPNGWSWNEEQEFRVVFRAPSGVGWGFIRAVDLVDVNAAIPAVMQAEAPDKGYTTAEGTLGAYPGVQVTTADGLVVWFISGQGRVYAISFTDDSGQFYTVVASSFRFT
jgi:hypothetical protein